MPFQSTFYPGSLYLHDLAQIGNSLYGNAVGHNAVVRFHKDGTYERVWWPNSINSPNGPRFGENLMQINGIAPGKTLKDSFFTASLARPGRYRPGHLKFPVDGTGVVFSGKKDEPICSGLTRPHSPRLIDGQLWLANSGYGEVGVVQDGAFRSAARLPGWTRGLCGVGDVVFVATSRVIPKYACYAPGLKVDESLCGVHALDRHTGKVLGSMIWPLGYQIFAVHALSREISHGFAFSASPLKNSPSYTDLFYSFDANTLRELSQ